MHGSNHADPRVQGRREAGCCLQDTSLPPHPFPHPLLAAFLPCCSQFNPSPPAPPDTTPPVITAFSGPIVAVRQGQLLTAAAGIGASAWDAVDGVISSVETLGLAGVNTSVVGGPNLPGSSAQVGILLGGRGGRRGGKAFVVIPAKSCRPRVAFGLPKPPSVSALGCMQIPRS